MTTTKRDMFVNFAGSESLDKRAIARLPGLVAWDEPATVLPFRAVNPDHNKEPTTVAPGQSNLPTQTTSQGPTTDGNGSDGIPPEPTKPLRLISIKDVLKRIAVPRRTLFNWEAQEKFPVRVLLPNGRAFWLESEIDEWIAGRTTRTLADNQD